MSRHTKDHTHTQRKRKHPLRPIRYLSVAVLFATTSVVAVQQPAGAAPANDDGLTATYEKAKRLADTATPSRQEDDATMPSAQGPRRFAVTTERDGLSINAPGGAARIRVPGSNGKPVGVRSVDPQTRTVVESAGRTGTIARVARSRAEATLAFTLELPPGFEARLNATGGISVANDDEGLFELGRPWAIDANGKQLPTLYTVRGSTVFQSVDTKGAAFPIVLDPSVWPGTHTCGWTTCTMYWTVSSTRYLYDYFSDDWEFVYGIANLAIAHMVGGGWWGFVVAAAAQAAYWQYKDQVGKAALAGDRCLTWKYTRTFPATGWFGSASYWTNANCWWGS